MIRSDIQRLDMFNEFTDEEKSKYFSVTGNKVIHNIDTLYYSIKLVEDEEYIEDMVNYLKGLKEQCNLSNTKEYPISDDLIFKPSYFSIYEFCISSENAFDIFIASYLPNEETPRILIQLRSIYLWSKGVKETIEYSFSSLNNILSEYGIKIAEVNENRIDYAFHTNIIQNTSKYFSDKNMVKSLKSSLKLYHKVGNIGREISIDYLSLGNRKSNNVFFRAYNKGREVIEQNYKGFFIDYWKENGLISEYDYYCYKKAYENKSYSGLLIGRCKWYLEYGKDEDIKKLCKTLIISCYKNSDNYEYIENSIKGILPEVTNITNIEYQTKRKFYHTMNNYINELSCSLSENNPFSRLYKILENRKNFLNYLTTKTVAFYNGSEPCSWWKRVQSVKVENKTDNEIQREYGHNIDKQKIKRNIASSIASLSIYLNKCNDNEFTDDISDVLSFFNDNDVNVIFYNNQNGAVQEILYNDYETIKKRKNRQLKNIIKE